MKVLRIEDSGFAWEVPAHVIAADRAKFYAEKGDDYEEELDFVMHDNYELKEWFANNMDWDDVKSAAVLVKTPDVLVAPHPDSWTIKVRED